MGTPLNARNFWRVKKWEFPEPSPRSDNMPPECGNVHTVASFDSSVVEGYLAKPRVTVQVHGIHIDLGEGAFSEKVS